MGSYDLKYLDTAVKTHTQQNTSHTQQNTSQHPYLTKAKHSDTNKPSSRREGEEEEAESRADRYAWMRHG